MTDVLRGPDSPAADRRRPAPGHVLRRRDRRAGRAVGDDVRELGRQDRLPARRGARPRARPAPVRRPAGALARSGVPRRRVDGRPGRDRPGRATPDAVVCGPDGLDRWAGAGRRPAGAGLLAAAAGRPLRRPAARRRPRRRHRGLVPAGRVHGVGPAGRRRPRRTRACTQGELWRAAAVGSLLTDGGRLLSEANPASPPGIATFTEPLARGGSLVLVAHAEPGRLDATYAAERATARFP